MERRELRRALVAAVVAAIGLTSATVKADPFVYMDREGNLHTIETPTEPADATATASPTAVRPSAEGDQDEDVEAFPYAAIVATASTTYDVPVALVRAIVSVESGFQPYAVSSAGARGLMQLMPRTADDLGVRDAFDPEENITAGARHLRLLLDTFDGSVPLAVAAYNAGIATVRRSGGIPAIPETQQYVTLVMARFYRWMGQTSTAPRAKSTPAASTVASAPPPGRRLASTRTAAAVKPATRARRTTPAPARSSPRTLSQRDAAGEARAE